jgi:hypothetical protein
VIVQGGIFFAYVDWSAGAGKGGARREQCSFHQVWLSEARAMDAIASSISSDTAVAESARQSGRMHGL